MVSREVNRLLHFLGGFCHFLFLHAAVGNLLEISEHALGRPVKVLLCAGQIVLTQLLPSELELLRRLVETRPVCWSSES